MPTEWQIVGGAAYGGILVRESEALSSNALDKRLTTGSLVEEVALKGDRLHYTLCSGSGPYRGWVSIVFKGKELAIRKQRPLPAEAGPSATVKTIPNTQAELPENLELQKSSRICVSALSMSGKRLKVNVARDCTTGDLKKRLAKNWLYPIECLKIVTDGAALANSEQLGVYCGEQGSELSVIVVVSLDELYSCLQENRLPAPQVSALRNLARMAPKNCDETIAVILKCLDSKAPTVRKQAVQALLEVAGMERARAEIEARFGSRDHDLQVRRNALHIWRELLAEESELDSRAVSSMRAVSEDSSADMRKLAVQILREELTKRARRGDKEYSVALAQSHLKQYMTLNSDFWLDLLWASPESANVLHADGLAIFVDARDIEAFQIDHIPDAWSLPEEKSRDLDDLDMHPALHVMKNKLKCSVVVYSTAGSVWSRDVAMATRLRQLLKPYRVLRLQGGLDFWKYRGLPVESGTDDSPLMHTGESTRGQVGDIREINSSSSV